MNFDDEPDLWIPCFRHSSALQVGTHEEMENKFVNGWKESGRSVSWVGGFLSSLGSGFSGRISGQSTLF